MKRTFVVLLVISACGLGCDPKEQSTELPSIEDGVADLQKEMSKSFTLSDEQKRRWGMLLQISAPPCRPRDLKLAKKLPISRFRIQRDRT